MLDWGTLATFGLVALGLIVVPGPVVILIVALAGER